MPKKRPTAAEGWLRNAAFNVADDSLDPALRRQMAAALRLELHNQTIKAAEFRQGRKDGAKNKKTSRLEAQFDKLINAPSSESARARAKVKSLKMMPRSTFARHWESAKKRAKK